MANVQFLRGPQANLDKLSSYQAGSFYLAEDSERLYYAQSDSKLVYLNKYIVPVDRINDLPKISDVNPGDLYYASKDNVLCVKETADSTTWTQINKNTDTDTGVKVTGIGVERENPETTDVLKYKITIDQVNYDAFTGDTIENLEAVTGSFEIPVAEMLASGISVSQTGKLDNGNLVLSNSGAGAGDGKIALIPGNGIAFDEDDDGFTISGKTYELKSDLTGQVATISLADEDGTKAGEAKFEAGLDVEFKQDENTKNIKINHKGYTYDDTNELSDQTPENEGSFSIITGLNVTNGHVTGVKTGTVSLPEDNDTIVTGVSADNEGQITISLTDAEGNELDSVVSGNDLYYKIGSNTIYNQSDLAEHLVTKNELKALNAMVYKGTIDDNVDVSDLYSNGEKASIGDVWLVNTTAVSYGADLIAERGDLLIVNGEENSDGYVDNIVWDYVPSADEVDTQYKLGVDSNTVQLKEASQGDVVSSVKFTTGTNNPIDIKSTIIDADSTSYQIEINHKTIADGKEEADQIAVDYEGVINAISSITKDSYGHITGYTITPYKLPESIDTKYSLALNDGKCQLVDNEGNVCGTVDVVDGTAISVVSSADGENGTKFTVNHANVSNSKEAAESAASVTSGGSLAYIKDVIVNDQGHVTKIVTDTAAFFSDTTYVYSGETSVSNNKATFTTQLKNGSGDSAGSANLDIKSSSLTLSKDNDGTVSMDLVWGSF